MTLHTYTPYQGFYSKPSLICQKFQQDFGPVEFGILPD